MIHNQKRVAVRKVFDHSILVGENITQYLMSGNASELIESPFVGWNGDTAIRAHIYGIVAQDRSAGRYCAIFLYYSGFIWRPFCFEQAFRIIKDLSEYERIQGILEKKQKTRLKKAA